ncbi:hypothetical protein [Leptothoe sp. PORK10 BA2]|uniref:hypothetical protein n=1 Tax=Leptothoe sp. PORK10 BA2 TaxID=3110254 RepID=UPI002B203F86|nr:hypothetical protein [Leptothoe sp. PORK10 BA2]MEA5464578.1 hypothetical protein [Leptothoe sp. PORK10 BA2]
MLDKSSASVKSSTLDRPPMSVEFSASARPATAVQSSLAGHRKPGLRVLIGLSLALHGGLLLLPMPQGGFSPVEPEPELENRVEESGAIALTTLPIVTKPKSENVSPIAPPLPAIAQPPSAPLTQVPENLPDEVLADLAESEQREDESDPAVPQPEQPPEQTEPDPENPAPEKGLAVQFSSDFPHIAGSLSGCYGLENCRRTEGENYTNVLDNLSKSLEAQGYELTPYDGNDDSDVRNHRIYEMRLPNDPQAGVKYLNVFGDGLKAAIYIITPHVITQAELAALETNN